MRWVTPAHSPLAWSDVLRVIGSNWRSQVQARDALRLAFHSRAALLCDSGTSALTAALKLASATHPGPIAIPAYGCFDIATAVSGSDDPVLLYDIHPTTLGPDVESLARALRAGARRVVVAPLYGIPLDWDALQQQCASSGALLIEDAAQGSGAEYDGRAHGALGELAVLSFGRGKGRSAGGGGAVLAQSLRMAEALRESDIHVAQAKQGMVGTAIRIAAQNALSSPSRFGAVASVPAFGIGETPLRAASPIAGMPDAQAALVALALERETQEIAVRRQHAARWLAKLPPSVRTATVPKGAKAGYLRFPVIRAPGALLTRAERKLGIGGAYPQILADLAPIAERRTTGLHEPLDGARLLVTRLVTLPTHSLLEEQDCEAITRWLEAQR